MRLLSKRVNVKKRRFCKRFKQVFKVHSYYTSHKYYQFRLTWSYVCLSVGLLQFEMSVFFAFVVQFEAREG